MREKEPRRAVPPNLLGTLSPNNHAWLLTQQVKSSRASQIYAEAIARQRGFIINDLGNFTVPPEVELRIIADQRSVEPIAEIISIGKNGNITEVVYNYDTARITEELT